MSRHLHTARFKLRPFIPDDLSQLGYFSDPAWRRYLGPEFPPATQFIANNTEVDWDRELSFAIVDGNRLLGSVHLGLDPPRGVGELACLIAPSDWGYGIAGEACRAVLDHGFGECGLFKAYARVDTRHARSIRVLETLGFMAEGVLRLHRRDSDGSRSDERWYGLLRSEWRPPT
jgi:ribosomal-protein-alanine N-acetyltransferase